MHPIKKARICQWSLDSCHPSLFIFSYDFRRNIRTRRGGAARRPNSGSNPPCTPALCLRKKRAQTTYIFAIAVEVKLQVMEEPSPFGPAQHLPAGSGKRLDGPDGRVNLSLFHHPPVRALLIKVNSSTATIELDGIESLAYNASYLRPTAGCSFFCASKGMPQKIKQKEQGGWNSCRKLSLWKQFAPPLDVTGYFEIGSTRRPGRLGAR